jgi:hypothetical protein
MVRNRRNVAFIAPVGLARQGGQLTEALPVLPAFRSEKPKKSRGRRASPL